MTTLVLVDLALILLAAQVAGWLMRLLNQPAVVGEIGAGVLLGATVLEHDLTARLFPADVASTVHAIGEVALVFYVCSVGYGLGHEPLRRHRGASIGVAVGSLFVPLVCGTGLALWLATRYEPTDPLVFVLFVGVAMAITAVPVLARILHDWQLTGTDTGRVAMAAAAIVDGVAWTLLAVVAAAAGDGTWMHLSLMVPYVLLMVFVVRPVYVAALPRMARVGAVPLVVAGLWLSASATAWLGLHAVFGAMLFGVVVSRRRCGELTRQVDNVTSVTSTVLLPIFFVTAGMSVDLSAVWQTGPVELIAILAIAVGAKLVGGYAGARVCGVRPDVAGAIAVLMNTRGVTEIVVLQIGLQLGIIDGRLYSLLLLVALLTTMLTGPLLLAVRRRSRASQVNGRATSSARIDAGSADLA